MKKKQGKKDVKGESEQAVKEREFTPWHVVKRKGHKEHFDGKKVYGSIYWACRSTGMHEEKCESISATLLEEVKKWFDEKKGITSDDIFRFVSEELKKHNWQAAYMYSTLRDIS